MMKEMIKTKMFSWLKMMNKQIVLNKRINWILIIVTILFCLFLCACSMQESREIVVYTAVDQVVSEPIFRDFERQTGIKVRAVYDLEANKTTGLTNRIYAEKDHPLCDVFWNNEFVNTIALFEKDLLQPYVSPNAADIPIAYKHNDGYWTAFGGRARVLLINRQLLQEKDFPSSFYDLLNTKYSAEQIAMAYPMFGTTRTHVAALYAQLGEQKARQLLQAIAQRGIQIVDGNSVTRDMVVAAQVAIAYTDTDDAKVALKQEADVTMIIPDQGDAQMGTLITPSTVAIIKGAPHTQDARLFVDYLLDRSLEEQLIEQGFFDLSVRDENNTIKGMSVSLYDIYLQLDNASRDMQQIFGGAR